MNPYRSIFRVLQILAASAITALNGYAQETVELSLTTIRANLENGREPVKIVCFGDSVTGLYYHTGGERTYTDMLGIALRQIYPKAKVAMINAGISGHTTVNALARIEKDVLAKQPDLVTVMFGLNDMTRVPIEIYEENLGKIIAQCRAIGAEVVLCTPNAVITTKARPVEKLEQYCEVVRKVAKETGVPLCDSFTEFEKMRGRDPIGWRLTLSDEIHPNMTGHKGIAEQLARTISSKSTSLAEIGPPPGAIGKTRELLKAGKPVKILAMPPFDGLIGDTIRSESPEATLEVIPWPVEGLSAYELMKDSNHRVRKLKPNLVLIAVPRSAKAANQEEFIRSRIWIVNYALSFGKKEWDALVIHPSVAGPVESDPENDELIRKLTAAHDLPLIDRVPGDKRSAAEILSTWLKNQ